MLGQSIADFNRMAIAQNRPCRPFAEVTAGIFRLHVDDTLYLAFASHWTRCRTAREFILGRRIPLWEAIMQPAKQANSNKQRRAGKTVSGDGFASKYRFVAKWRFNETPRHDR